MTTFFKIITFLADFTTILASSIAVYLYLFKRKYISTVFNVLVNYSSQLTLSELKEKLDRLNDLRAVEKNDRDEILNIFSEITGQLNGNPKLSEHFVAVIDKINEGTASKAKISEPWKRAMVSEIRERIRHVGIVHIEEISGDVK